MISNFDKAQLMSIMPAAREQDIERYIEALNTQLPRYKINTPLRMAHFIAQVAHESGSFKHHCEDLSYSAKALRCVFSKYFDCDEMAERYARKPQEIANLVYANRMGNGDTVSGDGWRYRGRGLIKLTGRENYANCAAFIDYDCVENPDLLLNDPQVAVAAACWYWHSRKLNDVADRDDLKRITGKISSGCHGLESRKGFYERARQVLR